LGGDHQPYLIQISGFANIIGNDQVAIVNGIKGAKE